MDRRPGERHDWGDDPCSGSVSIGYGRRPREDGRERSADAGLCPAALSSRQMTRPPCDEAAILSATASGSDSGRGAWVLAATILGSSLAFIDGTVVNVALPALQSAFGASLSDIQWVVEAYAVTLAALLLTGGSLGDLRGRRKVFAAGVTIFAGASAWCGLSRTIDELIAARALQGIGGGVSRSRQPVAHQRHVSSSETWPRNRDLVGIHGHYGRTWPSARRLAHSAPVVALDFLHQSPARGHRARHLDLARSRVAPPWRVGGSTGPASR